MWLCHCVIRTVDIFCLQVLFSGPCQWVCEGWSGWYKASRAAVLVRLEYSKLLQGDLVCLCLIYLCYRLAWFTFATGCLGLPLLPGGLVCLCLVYLCYLVAWFAFIWFTFVTWWLGLPLFGLPFLHGGLVYPCLVYLCYRVACFAFV